MKNSNQIIFTVLRLTACLLLTSGFCFAGVRWIPWESVTFSRPVDFFSVYTELKETPELLVLEEQSEKNKLRIHMGYRTDPLLNLPDISGLYHSRSNVNGWVDWRPGDGWRVGAGVTNWEIKSRSELEQIHARWESDYFNTPLLAGYRFELMDSDWEVAARLHHPAKRAYSLGIGWKKQNAGVKLQYHSWSRLAETEAFQVNDQELDSLFQARIYTGHSSLLSQLTIPLKSLSLDLTAGFSFTEPIRPDTEYWISDSSISLFSKIKLQKINEDKSPGWSVWGAYQESQIRNMGRRINPASGGFKRWHTAPIHQLYGAIGADKWLGAVNLGLQQVYLSVNTKPNSDALNTNSETLAMDRLGISDLLLIVPGLWQGSLLAEGEIDLHQTTLLNEFQLGGSRFTLSLQAPLSLNYLIAEGEVKQIEQKFLVKDTTDIRSGSVTGPYVMTSPGVESRLSYKYLEINAGVTQTLLLWSDWEISKNGSNSYPAPDASIEEFSWGENGLSWHVGLLIKW